MDASLKESHLATEMARVLYNFLPGSGAASWKGHISFKTVAIDVGVGNYWLGGSKEPAIAALLERTLNHKRYLFENLILTIVREGLKYRQKEGRPITRQEIETLNGLILQIGFKFPSLWDPEFLASLEGGLQQRAKAKIEEAVVQEKLKATELSEKAIRLAELKQRFYNLDAMSDRQAAGFAFEHFLNDLFSFFELEPRSPFKLRGEQIDGSFNLDNEIYLVEAKWHKEPISKVVLAAFRDSVASKSSVTRGVFIAVNGITSEAKEAITRGQAANFFVMDGCDITLVLEGMLELPRLLRWKLRCLAEEGQVFISGNDLVGQV